MSTLDYHSTSCFHFAAFLITSGTAFWQGEQGLVHKPSMCSCPSLMCQRIGSSPSWSFSLGLMCRCSWDTYVFPCIIQTRLEEPDREGEEDISKVHGVGMSHVVCLPSPLHVPCWVAPHQRHLCLSIDIGRKKHLEQVRLFSSSTHLTLNMCWPAPSLNPCAHSLLF